MKTKRPAVNRTFFFLSTVMILASAGRIQAAPQDKKTGNQDPPVSSTGTSASTGDGTKLSATPATTDPAYMIGPEDVLDINVWKEPDMSRSVPVRPDGKISLPLINDVQAAGSTPLQLASTVTDKLRKFLTDPQVTVIVTTINSQRVYVVGEVIRAGGFTLIPGMTVLQVLANAGGFTTFANVKKIHVMRVVNGKHIELPFNYRDVVKGDNPDQNIKLEPGDTVVVP
jgi:polysaccharide export outer membrane protein